MICDYLTITCLHESRDVTKGCVGERFSGAKEAEKHKLDMSRCVMLTSITPKECCAEKMIENALKTIGVEASRVIKLGNVSMYVHLRMYVCVCHQVWQC